MTQSDSSSELARRSPLYEAQHSARYERQRLIASYEQQYGARLAVLIDELFPHSVTLFEELLFDADPNQDLHVLLATPGGDGETAIRLVRQAQSRCRELTVIVPDQAKSAGTLFVLGAHTIMMGPTSDLGPVDPQFLMRDRSLAAGKTIVAAVENAEQRIQANPDAFPLYVSLLSDVSALLVQQAREAIARSGDQLREALASNPVRPSDEVRRLSENLREPLIGEPQSHGAIISSTDAARLGLPVVEMDPSESQWRAIWQLWTKYVALDPEGDIQIYEGSNASQVIKLEIEDETADD